MTSLDGLDRERIRELFDLRRRGDAGGRRQRLHATTPTRCSTGCGRPGPVHEGIVHELLGYDRPGYFQGLPEPDRPHFSVFDFETCDHVFRDEVRFPSVARAGARPTPARASTAACCA